MTTSTIASPIELSDWPIQRLRKAGWERTEDTAPSTLLAAGSRARRARSGEVVRTQLQLPPADVAPRTGLESDPAVDADGLEPERLVQCDAGVVGQGDAGARGAESEPVEGRQEVRVQRSPDALPGMAPVDVHRDVDRPPVGAAVAVRGRVGVAGDR